MMDYSLFFVFLTSFGVASGAAETAHGEPSGNDQPGKRLAISWENNFLTIRGSFPGNLLKIRYLEAYCRPGSTDRDWGQTVIGHQTVLVMADDDQRVIQLRDTLADGVIVDHTITAGVDEVDFRLVATNPTAQLSHAHWAQPCIRVDRFTGCDTGDARALVPAYARKCFLFLDGRLTRLPTTPWADRARYVPGQVYCPDGVNRDDVNPRPLSPLVPSNGLTGCFSADERQILAVAWEPYQEIFQGVITCIHSDFRIGGLKPGETKKIHGKIYFVDSDIPALLKRYRHDFPEQAGSESVPDQADVGAAMSKASAFMMDRLAYRGGFVWKYSLDLRERYGELKARDSMIWVEPPGTPTVGLMLIKAYEVTGEERYLAFADQVASALVEGQLPCGGWHYFIDFEPDGTQRYYDDFFSRQWGWQEYLHFYNNATFDDDVTASATRFLLRLNSTPLASKYNEALVQALDFILRAQYENGGWPQRFPPDGEFTQHGHPDYTPFSTFNDGVIANNIDLLLEASRQLGRTQYEEAARRGMDFYLVSQLPPPQAGWAQQYDQHLKPGWGRPFEPPAVCSTQTMENIADLIRFTLCTGDRKYLEPIPRALDWLEQAERVTPFAKPSTHTCFYALETNRPLFTRRTGQTYVDTRFEPSYDVDGAYPYGVRMRIDVGTLRERYKSTAAMSFDEARAEYERQVASRLPVVKVVSVGADTRVVANGPEEIRLLIDGLGLGDGWIVENRVIDIDDFLRKPPYVFRGYCTGTYVARMYRLMHYLERLQ